VIEKMGDTGPVWGGVNRAPTVKLPSRKFFTQVPEIPRPKKAPGNCEFVASTFRRDWPHIISDSFLIRFTSADFSLVIFVLNRRNSDWNY
jgi:hypothetical protein